MGSRSVGGPGSRPVMVSGSRIMPLVAPEAPKQLPPARVSTHDIDQQMDQPMDQPMDQHMDQHMDPHTDQHMDQNTDQHVEQQMDAPVASEVQLESDLPPTAAEVSWEDDML